MVDGAGSDRVLPRERGSIDSLVDLARSIVRELPALVGDRVELLSLELQRAGNALAKAAVLAVAAAIFALTAWLALWGVLVGLLIAMGWHWAQACAMAALINGAAAAWLLWRARSLLAMLGLPATRRHLLLGLRNKPERTPREPSDERRPAPESAAAP